MELFYVYCVKCAKRFIVSLFIVFELRVYLYCKCFDNNTHAGFFLQISVTLRKEIAIVLYENVLYT